MIAWVYLRHCFTNTHRTTNSTVSLAPHHVSVVCYSAGVLETLTDQHTSNNKQLIYLNVTICLCVCVFLCGCIRDTNTPTHIQQRITNLFSMSPYVCAYLCFCAGVLETRTHPHTSNNEQRLCFLLPPCVCVRLCVCVGIFETLTLQHVCTCVHLAAIYYHI